MSDTEDTTPNEAPRDGVTGRYVSGRQDGKAGDDGQPAQGGSQPAGTPPGDDAQAGKDDEKEGRKRWLLLLLLLLILLLLLCAGFVYMKWFKKPGETNTTPSASPTVVATTVSPTPKVSISPSISPSASPTVKTVAMPDVVGKPAPEAKTILEAAGFTNIKFVDEANPNDSLSLLVSYVVTKQSVAAGTQVPVDTALVITAKTSSSGKG
jgi:cytoskeletal protein RodZ